MMAQSWLPDACLTSRRAAQPMVNVIETWTEDWFKTSAWQALGSWDETSSQVTNNFVPMHRVGGLEIKGKDETEIVLAQALLEAVDEEVQTVDDRDLLHRLGACAIEDLKARISQIISPDEGTVFDRLTTSSPRLFSLLVGPIGAAQIALECSLEQLVQMTRSTYTAVSSVPKVAPYSDILEDLSVPVAVRLGSARISLKDLADLEEDDVLLLDSAPNEVANLVIDGRRSPLSFAIGEEDHAYTLEFQEKQ